MDKFEEVLKEVPRVREDFGYPPLVTPSSQIVGTQAVLNVVMGERYKMVPKEAKDLVKGMYGKTTVPIKQEVVDNIRRRMCSQKHYSLSLQRHSSKKEKQNCIR